MDKCHSTDQACVQRFYTILTAGYSFEREGSPRMSTGYGLGTAFVLSPKTLFTLEGTYHHLFNFDKPFTDGWNNQIHLSTLVETRLSRHMALAFGLADTVVMTGKQGKQT